MKMGKKSWHETWWFELIKIMLPAVVTVAGWCIVVAGWFVVNRLERNRDLDNKKLERRRDVYNKRLDIKVKYLIDAYRCIAFEAGRPFPIKTNMIEDDEKRIKNLEQAIADIQLFGNLPQINMAIEVCKNIVDPSSEEKMKKCGENMTALLTSLRLDLRDYLQLEKIKNPEVGVYHFRVFRHFSDGTVKCP